MTTTITRLFDRFTDAEAAIADLERLGVSHNDISLISNHADDGHGQYRARDPRDHTAGEEATSDAGKGAVAGGVLAGAAGLLAGLGLLAIPGLGPVVAAGWLASAATGAVAGGIVGGAAGGLIGALTNSGVSEEEAHVYAEAVRRGGTLVSAKVADDRLVEAEAALDGHRSVSAVDRGVVYRQEGWSRFDETAAAYQEDQLAADELERRRGL